MNRRPNCSSALQPDALALGCAPIVNLFQRQCEPVPLTYEHSEYLITPDMRRPRAMEVWSVESVRELQPDGSMRLWQPFYRRPAAAGSNEQPSAFYNTIRRDSPGPLSGTDVFLAPFDTQLDVNRPVDSVLSIDALCTNRDLPADLPFGHGQPRLRLSQAISAVTEVACLTAPGPSLRTPLRTTLKDHKAWRLISHLSLGHLSVAGGEAAADSLREVLGLYDLRDTADSRAVISGLLAVTSDAATARVPEARRGSFCRGVDVTLEFDARAWGTAGALPAGRSA